MHNGVWGVTLNVNITFVHVKESSKGHLFTAIQKEKAKYEQLEANGE